jgi:hypothetical protein
MSAGLWAYGLSKTSEQEIGSYNESIRPEELRRARDGLFESPLILEGQLEVCAHQHLDAGTEPVARISS